MRFKMRTAHVTSSSPERAPEDSEELARALRDMRRYEAFLAVGA